MSTQDTARDLQQPWDLDTLQSTVPPDAGNTRGTTAATETAVATEAAETEAADGAATASAASASDIPSTALIEHTEPHVVNVSYRFPSGLLPNRDRRTYLLSPSNLLTHRAEDFRQLRTHLKHRLGERGVVLIASPRHGEGRSITALNLGLALAQEYERVVYVEADFRRPALHAFFELEQGYGICQLLQRQDPIGDDVGSQLLPTDVPGFYLMPAGVRSGPPELFESPRMAEALARLKIEADWVIVDGPPMLTYAESQVLAKLVDGVVIVALEGRTRDDDIVRMSTQLESIKANVVGAVYVRRG